MRSEQMDNRRSNGLTSEATMSKDRCETKRQSAAQVFIGEAPRSKDRSEVWRQSAEQWAYRRNAREQRTLWNKARSAAQVFIGETAMSKTDAE